jgi:hypothetical protein
MEHPKGRGRREIIDDMRRKIERALVVAGPAEELAAAAQAVVTAAQLERVDAGSVELQALGDALARYRQAVTDNRER